MKRTWALATTFSDIWITRDWVGEFLPERTDPRFRDFEINVLAKAEQHPPDFCFMPHDFRPFVSERLLDYLIETFGSKLISAQPYPLRYQGKAGQPYFWVDVATKVAPVVSAESNEKTIRYWKFRGLGDNSIEFRRFRRGIGRSIFPNYDPNFVEQNGIVAAGLTESGFSHEFVNFLFVSDDVYHGIMDTGFTGFMPIPFNNGESDCISLKQRRDTRLWDRGLRTPQIQADYPFPLIWDDDASEIVNWTRMTPAEVIKRYDLRNYEECQRRMNAEVRSGAWFSMEPPA